MYDNYEYPAGSFAGPESDNMEAVYQYFLRTTAQTPEADRIKREFLDWYSAEIRDDWWVSEENVNDAYRRRNSFNQANARTPAEKAQVKRVIETGFTSTPAGRETIEDSISWGKIGVVAAIGTGVAFVLKFLFKH
jgi:hypothetical protein